MAVVRRNDKDKVPSAGWQCVVLKYANLTLQEEKDTFRQDGVSVDIQWQWMYLAAGPNDESSVNFHGSGWHGEWAEGESNEIHMFFNHRGLGEESDYYAPPLRHSYVFKTPEKYLDQAVYRGHDYKGRKLKLVLEATYTVTDKHEWQIRPDSQGKLIVFEKKAPFWMFGRT